MYVRACLTLALSHFHVGIFVYYYISSTIFRDEISMLAYRTAAFCVEVVMVCRQACGDAKAVPARPSLRGFMYMLPSAIRILAHNPSRSVVHVHKISGKNSAT